MSASSRLPRLLLVLTALGLALGASEAWVRSTGHQPWRYMGFAAREPVMHEDDRELGWHAKPGRYTVPPYTRDAKRIKMGFGATGQRVTSRSAEPRETSLLLVGASYTQGWAVSDEETFAWRLQERFPSVRIVNRGTAGYSTYQSLIVMERALAGPDPPSVVLYPFPRLIERRNVAEAGWLHVLARLSHRGAVATPYCTLDAEGELVRHPPRRYVEWPLREQLAIVTLGENVYEQLRGRRRASQATRVTEELLLEMARLAKSRDSRFAVIFLTFSEEERASYEQLLKTHRVDSAYCPPERLGPGLIVRGEGHPNAKANAIWAGCLALFLQEQYGF